MVVSFDPRLVTLSILVAWLVSLTAWRLLAHIAESGRVAARMWLILGATTMGIGIWAMHFIGMLAMVVPIRLTYDLGPTAWSLVIAVVTSGLAIQIASRGPAGPAHYFGSGVALAAGMVAMHYVGMGAIPVTPAIDYNPWVVIGSVVIALLTSCAALGLAFRQPGEGRPRRPLARPAAALCLCLGLVAMHYTGMAAARFRAGAVSLGGLALDRHWLAVVVGIAALGLLSLALVASVFETQLAVRARLHAARLQKANRILNHQAHHDSLTGLPNRSQFIERLRQAIADASTEVPHIAVMLVDLDRFKSINDSLGHTAGDAVLKEMAGRLESRLPGSGLAARLGGDEFLVMAPVSEPRLALQLAESIVRRIADPYELDGFELQVGASIGITTYPFDRSKPEVLISHADEAMYEAKRAGGNGLHFFVPGTTAYTMARLRLESDLRRAATRGQLRLHYQPQLQVGSGRIVGLEALVRWLHPELGWIQPGDFIPLAERSDAIEDIGRWVLDESCRQLRDWRDRGVLDVPIAVNVSAREFRRPGLVEQIWRSIQAHGLEPRHIEIELTESLVMSDGDRSIETLEELHAAGFGIALDDFGTGYSSMAYLKRLPVAKLKIDRSFITDLGSSKESDSIVKAVISLAHALGIVVIAEGVEDAWQLSALEAFGCDQYQGYFFSPACEAAEVESLLTRRAAAAPDAMLAATVLGVVI